jgi:hypothetical protein
MRWGPRLVLRFGSHGVASPTSGVGHLLDLLVAAVIAAGAAASLFGAPSPGRLLRIVLAAWLLLLARTLRDAWAWRAATDAERASFRAEVEALRPWTPPPGYAPIFDANRCRRATGALLVAAVAVSIAQVRWHEELVVPALFAAALVVTAGLDLGRGRAVRAQFPAA